MEIKILDFWLQRPLIHTGCFNKFWIEGFLKWKSQNCS